MKRLDVLLLGIFISIVAVFFYKTLFFGLIPVPTDDLVGLYHPYRDLKAAEYPNGIPYKNFLITDPIRQQIPWRKRVIDSFKEGTVPTWDATSFSGTPLLANIQSGALYPLNILFFVLPFPVAWMLLIISQTLLAGMFMYIFLRVLALDPMPALFGSVLFSFSGTSIAWLTWGTIVSAWMWTPLALSAVHLLITHERKNSTHWILIGIGALACSFFAGHLQMFFYSSLTVGVYALWQLNTHKKTHSLYSLLTVGVGALAIISYQLVAILKWLPDTARITGGSAWQKEGFFIPIQHLVQFLAPDFFGNPATLNYWGTWNYGEMVGYIGFAGLIFALMGLGKKTSFWGLLACVALLFAVESPASSLPFVFHIPFLSSLQPTRLLIVVDLSLSVLAAFGFSEVLIKGKKNSLYILILGVVLAGLWSIYAMHGRFGISVENAMVIKRNLYMPTLLLGISVMFDVLLRFIKKHEMRMGLGLLIIVVVAIDLLRFGWKFTPFTDQSLFFPKTKVISYLESAPKPFRTMTLDDRILPPDTNTFYGIESVNGYDPIHSERYDKFIAAMERGEPNITPPYGYERIIVPKNINSKLFNLLGVRYILSFNELNDKRFKKVLTEGQTHVYENMSVLPRAYLASNIIYRKTEEEIINTLYSKDFDCKFDAVVEKPVDILSTELQSGESATITHYEPGKMTINVKTTQPRLLVIGNMYNPNWKATVDGKSVPIIRTNYLFMSIIVQNYMSRVFISI